MEFLIFCLRVVKVRRSGGGGEREQQLSSLGPGVWKDGYQFLCLSSGFSTVNGGASALLASKSRGDKNLEILADDACDG
jgi:hypothetical protein